MAGISILRQLFATGTKESGHSTGNQAPGEVVEIGDFRIDTGRHAASLQGQQLELTGEEFDVLVFLTANPQRFVAQQTMLATNWSGGTHQTQFLRTLISLRKKLEIAAAGQQYLRTEPWVIYRFAPSESTAR